MTTTDRKRAQERSRRSAGGPAVGRQGSPVSFPRGTPGQRRGAYFIAAPSGSLGLTDPPRRPAQDPLGQLVGETRGRLLRELADLPTTTTDLAGILVVTRPTVSHHLRVLAFTGVGEPHRVGPEVFYHLSARGRALVRLWRR